MARQPVTQQGCAVVMVGATRTSWSVMQVSQEPLFGTHVCGSHRCTTSPAHPNAAHPECATCLCSHSHHRAGPLPWGRRAGPSVLVLLCNCHTGPVGCQACSATQGIILWSLQHQPRPGSFIVSPCQWVRAHLQGNLVMSSTFSPCTSD